MYLLQILTRKKPKLHLLDCIQQLLNASIEKRLSLLDPATKANLNRACV
jgi:hypothetical protein